MTTDDTMTLAYQIKEKHRKDKSVELIKTTGEKGGFLLQIVSTVREGKCNVCPFFLEYLELYQSDFVIISFMQTHLWS